MNHQALWRGAMKLGPGERNPNQYIVFNAIEKQLIRQSDPGTDFDAADYCVNEIKSWQWQYHNGLQNKVEICLRLEKFNTCGILLARRMLLVLPAKDLEGYEEYLPEAIPQLVIKCAHGTFYKQYFKFEQIDITKQYEEWLEELKDKRKDGEQNVYNT